jgi:hypothetical protein
MNTTHGVPAAQFRTTWQPLQHLAPDQNVITDNMTGTPLDTHHFALFATEENFNRDAMVSNNNAPAPGFKIGSIAGSATGT